MGRSAQKSPRSGAGGASRGFTLIELMVVVAIIGILAALAVYTLDGATGRAKAVSVDDAVYGMLSEGRALAITKNQPVLVVVDFDTTATSSGHGGVYEILDPGREFSPNKMASWASTYTLASGTNPISANPSIWTLGLAQLRNSIRFNQSGVAGNVAQPTAAQISTFATATAAVWSNSPWPQPSSTAVGHSISGTGCSFCHGNLGYMWVQADGSVLLSDPNDLTKTQLVGNKGYLLLASPAHNQIDRAVLIATPSGLTQFQER